MKSITPMGRPSPFFIITFISKDHFYSVQKVEKDEKNYKEKLIKVTVNLRVPSGWEILIPKSMEGNHGYLRCLVSCWSIFCATFIHIDQSMASTPKEENMPHLQSNKLQFSIIAIKVFLYCRPSNIDLFHVSGI